MKQKLLLSFLAFLCFSTSYSQTASAQDLKDLEAAETKMFDNVKYPQALSYFKTDVTEDFYSINADGTATNKYTSTLDTNRLKMFSAATYKQFDRKFRIYGNTGITNGRMQAFMNDVYVVEFLYTTVFVKENGKWMYASWQGTISKDSPPAPPMPKN